MIARVQRILVCAPVQLDFRLKNNEEITTQTASEDFPEDLRYLDSVITGVCYDEQPTQIRLPTLVRVQTHICHVRW